MPDADLLAGREMARGLPREEADTFVKRFFAEPITDDLALTHLMHNPGGFCQGLVFDHHNAYCIHWGGCLHARHVLEGICPACGEPFRTRGTHWAVCLNVLPGPMLWRARVISPPCPHHDAGMACEFCDQPDNRIFVVERLIVPPTLGHGSGRHVDRIRGMIGRVSCPFDTDGDGHCGRVGCPNCGGPPHG